MISLDFLFTPTHSFLGHTAAWFRFCCRFMRFIIKMQTLDLMPTNESCNKNLPMGVVGNGPFVPAKDKKRW